MLVGQKLHFSEIFIDIREAISFGRDTVKGGFSSDILSNYYHAFVFAALFRIKKIPSWILGNYDLHCNHEQIADKSCA